MKNNKKLSEFLFWFSQIIFVIFEYAIVITLFVLMAKNLFTDDYNDPYFKNFLPNECSKTYALGVLAIKFILWIKGLFI